MITFGELLGSKQKQEGMLDLSQHAEVLGKDIPDIELNRVGQYRLAQLLRRRFGAGYKSFGKAREIMANFEKELKFQSLKNQAGRGRNGAHR